MRAFLIQEPVGALFRLQEIISLFVMLYTINIISINLNIAETAKDFFELKYVIFFYVLMIIQVCSFSV